MADKRAKQGKAGSPFEGLFLNERGNTLLYGDDGAMVAWLDLPDGSILEVGLTPSNYPALLVNTLKAGEVRTLSKHIAKLLSEGWEASKLNHLAEEDRALGVE